MKLSKNIENEIVKLIRSGYNVDSIILRLNKRYKELGLKKSDVIIVAKKYGINTFGKKDLTTVKGKVQEAENNLAFAMSQQPMVNKIKKSLIGLFVGICLLLACLWVIFGFKIFIISLGIVMGVVFILCLFSYFKFVRGNKEVSRLIKNVGNKNIDKKG